MFHLKPGVFNKLYMKLGIYEIRFKIINRGRWESLGKFLKYLSNHKSKF